MFYVYILQSQTTKELYKGSTEDLRNRLLVHNSGKAIATKHGVPWKLVYYEAFLSKADARREELFLKSGKGRERIKWLLSSL
jgi:putative endonuclease